MLRIMGELFKGITQSEHSVEGGADKQISKCFAGEVAEVLIDGGRSCDKEPTFHDAVACEMAEQLRDTEVPVYSQIFKIGYLRVHRYNKLNYAKLDASVYEMAGVLIYFA